LTSIYSFVVSLVMLWCNAETQFLVLRCYFGFLVLNLRHSASTLCSIDL
jgi:hypothetical protein